MYITYFFKFAACSAVLLILYHLVLEKEKMLTFNRFYLLFSIIFSGLAPLLTFELSLFPPATAALAPENLLPVVSFSDIQNESPIVSEITGTQQLTREAYCWAIYGTITLILLVRLVTNLYSFWKSIHTNQVTKNNCLQLVLLTRKTTPYSFGSYVFVNQGEYENGEIESEILVHEQAHIQQRHSLDIVFVELLLVFAWWNPALWLYRKAIMLNHEFLADDWVIKISNNVVVYQHLLLQKITHNKSIMLASPFNYLITKKRFKMMSRITSLPRVYALQIGTAVLFAVLLLAFGDISFAQTTPPAVASPASREAVSFTQEGVSREQLEEYNQLVAKYLKKGIKNGVEWSLLNRPNETDRARLEVIFKTMSKEQQMAQKYTMNPPLPPLFRATPTEKEFEAYKNPKVYGVWINEKKVPNTELNKYKASDFSQVFVSKLVGAALKTIGHKYKYQLDLMTNEYYEKYRAEELADKRYQLGYNWENMRKKNK